VKGNVAADCVQQRNMWPADRDGPRQQWNRAQGWRSDWNS